MMTSSLGTRARRRPKGRDDAVDVVDAAPPDAAADPLKRRPEPGVVGKAGIGRERRVGGAAVEDPRALLGPELRALGADQVDRAFQLDPIDDDPDQVAVPDLA